jgi:hypothetical protein
LRKALKRRDPDEERGTKLKVPAAATKRQTPQVAALRAIVANNTCLSGARLCKKFDSENIQVPFDGAATWAKAYMNAKLRQKIQVILSKDRRLAKV